MKKKVIDICLSKVQNELFSLCNKVIQIIDNYFLCNTTDIEKQVSSLKIGSFTAIIRRLSQIPL
jgi:hypothetical protein